MKQEEELGQTLKSKAALASQLQAASKELEEKRREHQDDQEKLCETKANNDQVSQVSFLL